jgi:hypothetical protein
MNDDHTDTISKRYEDLRMRLSRLLLISLALGLTGQSVFAHHSTKGIYDESVELELTGTVKAWRFINPHPSLILAVVDENGVTHDWDVSYGGAAVVHLQRRGYNADTFKAGDVIVVKGKPALVKDAYGLLIEGGNPTRVDGTPIP